MTESERWRGHCSLWARMLRGDERGSVFAEYVIVLSLVTVVGAATIAALGIPLLALFRHARMLILLPFP